MEYSIDFNSVRNKVISNLSGGRCSIQSSEHNM